MIFPISRPSIISYLHYAHDLSVAETDSRAHQYLALDFLQLHTRIDNTGVLLVDFYSHQTNYHPSCPILHRKLFSGKDAELLGVEPVAKACTLLDAGSYVRVDLDEYYVSGTLSYKKENKRGKSVPKKIRHVNFNLIYGYSSIERKFLSYGFNEQRYYDKRDISFDDFTEAYYGDDVGLWSLRLTPADVPANPEYSLVSVIKNLTGFMESRNAFNDSIETTSPAPANDAANTTSKAGAFGMATYDAAVDSVTRHNARMIDIRPWCIFCDHKRSMVNLYNFLVVEKKITPDENLLDQLKFIQEDFMNLRNYLMEAAYYDRTVKIISLKNNINKLKELETQAITKLIAVL